MPVSATPATDLPFNNGGRARVWISVGVVNSFSSRVWRRLERRVNSLKEGIGRYTTVGGNLKC